MTIKIITQDIPKCTIAFVHSSIEWGDNRERDFKFEISDAGYIIMAYDKLFYWAEGKSINEAFKFIENREKEFYAYQERIRKNFLSKNKIDMLFYEEEIKKRKLWEQEHWVCTEGGEGYYDFRD